MAKKQDNTKLPGTVFSPNQVRVLKVAVIVMGILLVGGFAFVLAAIVYQASHPKQASVATVPAMDMGSAPNIELPVAPGSNVAALSLDGNHLAINLNGSDGLEILVIDLASGRVLSRVKLQPQ